MMSNTLSGMSLVEPTVDTRPWWEALARGELTVPTCHSCSKKFFPPQAFCCNCGSSDWSCDPSDGVGKLYSWVVIHHAFSPEVADKVPYAIVAVDLDDGGRLIGRLLGEPSGLQNSMPMRARIFLENGNPLLGFEPA
jgi:uncharacterized OB-fold protein